MPGYLLFSYKRHLYPFTNKLHHRFPFRFPLPPPYLPLYFHPPYTPSIFTTSADRWSVNRTPFHPATSLPPFLSVLIFDVHHCYKRFPPSFESTSSFPPSRDSMPAHRNFSCFYFYRIAALFRIVLSSFFLSFPLYVRISPPPSPSPLPSPYLLPFIVDPW